MTKVTNELERKIVAVGASKILTECPVMLSQPYLQYWSTLLQSLIELFELSPDSNNFKIENGGQLTYAHPKKSISREWHSVQDQRSPLDPSTTASAALPDSPAHLV
uniref:Exportin-2 C-terminal domain-containing protein n=1 Tax=Glossina brevipalpis TaxID=37001 RepID=A0A1A9WRC8_9MUSC